MSVVEVWKWCLGRALGTTAGSLRSCRPIALETSEWHMAGRVAGQGCDETVLQTNQPVRFPIHSETPWWQTQKTAGDRETLSCLHNTQENSPGKTWLSWEKSLDEPKQVCFSLSRLETAAAHNWSMSTAYFSNNKIHTGSHNVTQCNYAGAADTRAQSQASYLCLVMELKGIEGGRGTQSFQL